MHYLRIKGFTLIELMVVIAIVAVMTTFALPTYHGYIQKAAMTNIVQLAMPYKTAVEVCAMTMNNGKSRIDPNCQHGKNGIPEAYQANEDSTGYVKSILVNANGIITIEGNKSLSSLTINLTPSIDSQGNINWAKQCQSEQKDLVVVCNAAFRFKESAVNLS